MTQEQKIRWAVALLTAGLPLREVARLLEATEDFVADCSAAALIVSSELRRAA